MHEQRANKNKKRHRAYRSRRLEKRGICDGRCHDGAFNP